ncbi:hypothetical protein [Nocardia sp. BMG111209]|uniref:hypothetical protein n=1 Tax=Nocardia sp. BMG111209 TaxID=1160137 RepID=UPI00037D7A62|nr:hypothetical protein [Nocardia sp. BMG111209]
MTEYENEPSSVPSRDALRAGELLNFVLSLGFYVVCGAIALLPRSMRARPLESFVGWSERVDESRYR